MGLTCAVLAGGADFLGGIASKRMSALRVTAAVAITGLLVLSVAWMVLGGTWSDSAVLWGILSGVSLAIGLTLLYGCLALGPMSVLSPLTALISATVPTLSGLLSGEHLGSIGYLALGTAFVAVLLVGLVREQTATRATARAVVMSVSSGVMIGLFLIMLDQTPADSGVLPVLFNRAAMAVVMLAMIGVSTLFAWQKRNLQTDAASEPGDIVSSPVMSAGAAADTATPSAIHTALLTARNLGAGNLIRPPRVRQPLVLAIGAGVLDATAIGALLVGMRAGDLITISVLNAMYPGGTIVLAALLLRERMVPLQMVGLVLALAAAAMFALS